MEKKHFTAKDVPANFEHKRNSSHSFWIIFLSILFFLFLLFSKWDKIEDFFGKSLDNSWITSGFEIGEVVSVEGLLTQDGDFVTHTHKLSTLSSGVFGLKSKVVNLNQYSWTVLIEWTIDREYKDLYIIDVSRVIAQFSDDEQLSWDVVETWPSVWLYMPNAWIYFSEEFFSKYTIESTGSDFIKIKSLTDNQEIALDYFVCKKGDSNRDCKQLSSTFSSANEKTFTTQYGITFYKLAEVNSWYFANGEMFGYFINDAPEQDIIDISSYIVLPTSSYIKDNLEPFVSSLCKQGNIVMDSFETLSLDYDKWDIIANLVWSWEKWLAECKILLDLSLQKLWTLADFTYEEDQMTGDLEEEIPVVDMNEDEDVEEVDEPKPIPSDVEQFPLFLDKPLVFTSSRGHSISFPSPKISYKSDSVSENLDTAWVNCYVATKVIEYAKKDLIDSEPSVIVYECKIKEGVEIPYKYYVYPVSDWRTFVADAIDPAWNDFANNLEVTLNE